MASAGMTSRVSSVALRLPAIQHPISKLGDPETISLRGYSTDYTRDQKCLIRGRGRPLSREVESLDSVFRSQTSKSIRSLLSEKAPRKERNSFTLPTQIPEGVEVIPAPDPGKPRLPIFGQTVAPENRTVSRVTSRTSATHSCSGAQLRIQVDQLEHELRESIQTCDHLIITLKNLFKNNHPEGKALVNRDVLLVILTKFLGRFITVKQFRQLLLRLHLSEKAVICFEELYGALFAPILKGPAVWFSPAQQPVAVAPLRASQVLSLLRGPAQSRFLEFIESLPGVEQQGPGWIVAPELKSVLEQLELHVEDQEFEKLWKRFDIDSLGAVKLTVLLKKLGLRKRKKPDNIENNDPHVSTPANAEDSKTRPRVLSKAEEERRASIAMETWLKDRFREGVQRMKAEFDKLDPDCCGKVGPDQFLLVLRSFGLGLKREHLGLFLARCGLELRKTGVDYPEFLRRFQDRSEDGVIHRILSNPQHRFHKEENVSHASSITAVEATLARLFQSEYLSLLEMFQNIDKLNKRTVSQEEFRAAVESRFGLEISDPEFEQLLDRLPLDRHGSVQYLVFMAAFDTRKGVPSLFEARPVRDGGATDGIEGEVTRDHGMGEERGILGRGVTELYRGIRSLVKERYPAVERVFEELDEKNTKRLTQEAMYQLLRRFNLQPEVSRGEIRRLWATLITNQDGTLDFLQFSRHFGHSPRSSRFPNAKLSPPKQGDGDLMRCSKKLNCVSDILVDSVRAKVELCVDALRGEFEDMDPYRTGFVSQEEFKEVLMGLCVHLNRYECDVLTRKFDINHDGRVSYIEFLRPFATQRQAWRYGSNMATVLQSHRDTGDLPEGKDTPSLRPLSVRLRKKLQRRAGALRRACRRLDHSESGFLSMAELQAVLQLCEVTLDPDDLYHILSLLDRDLSGRLDYHTLLQESRGRQTWRERERARERGRATDRAPE